MRRILVLLFAMVFSCNAAVYAQSGYVVRVLAKPSFQKELAAAADRGGNKVKNGRKKAKNAAAARRAAKQAAAAQRVTKNADAARQAAKNATVRQGSQKELLEAARQASQTGLSETAKKAAARRSAQKGSNKGSNKGQFKKGSQGPYIARVTRYINAPLSSKQQAEDLVASMNPDNLSSFEGSRVIKTAKGEIVIPEIRIVAEFPVPILSNPASMWGSYRYLRKLTALSRQSGTVNPRYAQKWKRIFDVASYNGVHHIINKSTLKTIYYDMKSAAAKKGERLNISLNDMQNDAPASLHPYHGNPEFSVLFHNLNRQRALYEDGGVRAVLEDYFYGLKELHRTFPREAPFVPDDVIRNTMKEARLWAETYHLRWE